MSIVEELAQSLGLYEEIAALLVKRGMDTLDKAKSFLYPSLQDMVSSADIANMAAAVARIRQAIADNERVLVFGDYDCDGICATAIMVLCLRSQGVDVHYHIPRRANGYGLSEAAVERVVEAYLPDLMITVDCGITAVDEVQYAQDLGVDVIVTDHHEPQEMLPDCIVVNPKLGDNQALADLCGAGVAMKVVEALQGKDEAERYLDLAALATVADVVPLTGDNRIIVRHGLDKIAHSTRKGLRELVRSCELEEVTATDVGFRLAPRINALGRLNDEADVVQLLLTDDDFVVHELVQKVNVANATRQTLTKQLLAQAYEQLTNYDLTSYRVIVLWDEHWESGVLGLVASRLCSEFYRPIVLLSQVGDVYKGSARSIAGVNIFQCLQAVEQRLVTYGGHMGAAGMSVTPNNLAAFREELNRYIVDHYDDSVFVRVPSADIVLHRNMVTEAFYEQVRRLEPFGLGNPAPKFSLSAMECRLTRINETDHVKCRLNAEADVVGFGAPQLLTAAALSVPCEYYCELNKRTFQNRQYLQLNITEWVFQGLHSARDSAAAFGNYLKTLVYAPRQVGTRMSNLDKEVAQLSGNMGTLFVAFCVDSARDLMQALLACGKKQLLGRLSVGKTESNPINTLLLCPTDTSGWQYYSSIVFLDAPLSTGYLNWVGTKAPNPELVLLPRYAFLSQMASLHLDENSVLHTQKTIARVGGRTKNLDELCMLLQQDGYSVADAYAHFYILYESGALTVGQGFALRVSDAPVALERSRVYASLCKLKEKA